MKIQLIIGAVVLTLFLSLSGTVYYLNNKLDNTQDALIVEKTNNVTLQQNIKDYEQQIENITLLLSKANKELTGIKNEREVNKKVLQDTTRLETLAKAKADTITRLAIDATARLWDEVERFSQEAASDMPTTSTD